MRATSVLALLLMALTSCGFHLRGMGPNERLHLPPTWVQSDAAALNTALTQALAGAGVQLVTRRDIAGMVLLAREEQQRRVLSTGTRGQAREHELRLVLTFSALGPAGEEVLASQTLSQVRDITFNEADVLAKETEEVQLIATMRRDLVQGMLRRLRQVRVP